MSTEDLRRRTVRSLLWQLLGTGGQRVVQLGGLAVIARQIDQQDLGLFAIVLTGIVAVEALTAFTGEQSQIHSDRGGERGYLDSVFLVRLLRGVVVGLLLLAAAPAFAAFFARPEYVERYWLTGLFMALAGNGLLEGLQSPARAARIKQLAFRRVAVGDLAAACFGTGIKVGLAIWLRDVWALVLGQLAETAVRSGISYAVAPYRPRFRPDREALLELRQYTLRGAGVPFLLMLILQAPQLVLGKIFPGEVLAIYNYGERLAKIPEDLSLRVLSPVAMSAYAALRHEPARLGAALRRALTTLLLLMLPVTVGMAWVGEALPALVFGPTFAAIPGLFPLLAVHGGLCAATAVIGPLFWAVGVPHLDRRAQFVRCALLYGLGIPLAAAFGATGFAAASIAAIATALLLCLCFARRELQLSWGAIAGCARPGATAGGLLLLALLACDLLAAPAGPVRVAIGIALGSLCLLANARRLGLSRENAPA